MKPSLGLFSVPFVLVVLTLGCLSANNPRSGLDKAKMRCRDLVLKIEPARADLVEYASGLLDRAFSLSNDLDAAAIADLEPDLRRLGRRASDLAKRLQAIAEVADDYIRTSSLLGTAGVDSGVGE